MNIKALIYLFTLLAILLSSDSYSQKDLFSGEDLPKMSSDVEEKFFVMWGWNRAWYTDSDIHFTGEGYDFTLHGAPAKDSPTAFSGNDYLNPLRVTIPQTNFRMGYYLKPNLTISGGLDHMKYVMVNNVHIPMSGYISNTGTRYDGIYDDAKFRLDVPFLTYEHTDGLNYINIEVARMNDLLDVFGNSVVQRDFEINVIEGVGAGALVPRTNAQLLNNARADYFHLSGYGLHAHLGMNVTFKKHFFLQTTAKGGYINMPDVRPTNDAADKASQSFYFFQYNWTFGFNVYIK